MNFTALPWAMWLAEEDANTEFLVPGAHLLPRSYAVKDLFTTIGSANWPLQKYEPVDTINQMCAPHWIIGTCKI